MTVSLSQQAYQQIQGKIITLELAPGAIIDEAALQAELGLGRTPIREALQRLAHEKLVVILPRRGMFVSEIGVMDLQRIFELRLALECLAVRLAAQRGTDEHWSRMEAELRSLLQAGDSSSNLDQASIDQACHKIIYEAADNPFLRDVLAVHYALSLRFWHYFQAAIGSMASAIEEHRAILEALKNQDPDLAASLMAAHIRSFQAQFQTQVAGSGATP